jgi:MFS family permease
MRAALGTGFARLWAASATSNLGDGVYGTALPLLAATLTRDPLLVSVVSFAEWLPWLLFGLLSGPLLDRWDRRRVMWTVDAARFAVVGGLAVAVVVGEAGIALLAAVGFLLGTGQTLVDTGAHSILPALVSRDPQRLERASGRLIGAQVVTQELAGPPPSPPPALVPSRVTGLGRPPCGPRSPRGCAGWPPIGCCARRPSWSRS